MATSPLRDDPVLDVPQWSASMTSDANVIAFPGPVIGSEGLAGSKTMFRRYGKRMFDIALAVPILLLTLPVIFAAAIAVLATSGWPIFYVAECEGNDGRPLHTWKLRTMVKDTDAVLALWRA